jgi:FkbM family methyltransferase
MPVPVVEDLRRRLASALSNVNRGQLDAAVVDRAASLRNRPIVLFGCGSLGRKCLATLRAAGIEPAAFADNNPRLWNSAVEGVLVLGPDEAAKRFAQSASFVVTIFNPKHRYSATRNQLQHIGCSTVVSFPEFARCFAESLLPYYAVDAAHKVIEQQAEIEEAFALLSDDASRREFVDQIAWRIADLTEPGQEPVAGEQYFADDLFSPSATEDFIDCGACDGDTLASFLRHYPDGFAGYVAFEPDPQNFSVLSDYVRTLPAELQSRVAIYRSATGARRGTACFAAEGTAASALSPLGKVSVSVVALDEQLADDTPTFLKMDIEGAEEDTLQGAARLIRRFRPLLAICVYHRQSDLWRLPLLINQICSDYSFHIRRYEEDNWDVVLYAVPASRRIPAAAAPNAPA